MPPGAEKSLESSCFMAQWHGVRRLSQLQRPKISTFSRSSLPANTIEWWARWSCERPCDRAPVAAAWDPAMPRFALGFDVSRRLAGESACWERYDATAVDRRPKAAAEFSHRTVPLTDRSGNFGRMSAARKRSRQARVRNRATVGCFLLQDATASGFETARMSTSDAKPEYVRATPKGFCLA